MQTSIENDAVNNKLVTISELVRQADVVGLKTATAVQRIKRAGINPDAKVPMRFLASRADEIVNIIKTAPESQLDGAEKAWTSHDYAKSLQERQRLNRWNY